MNANGAGRLTGEVVGDSDRESRVIAFQKLVVDRATGTFTNPLLYEKLRRELLADRELAASLPDFVRDCATLDQFWPFIRDKLPTYQQRRDYLWAQFRPLLDNLAGIPARPGDSFVSEALDQLKVGSVQRIWERAIARREADPEGAITAARTLLESGLQAHPR